MAWKKGEEKLSVPTREKGKVFKPEVSVGTEKQMGHRRKNPE